METKQNKRPHIVEQPEKLASFLEKKIGKMSGSRIKQLIKFKKITVNQQFAKHANVELQIGDQVEIDLQKVSVAVKQDEMRFPILFEDQFVIAVHKPAGVLSNGGDSDYNPSVFKQIDTYLKINKKSNERAFIVHRLDRETEGIILFAKSKEMQTAVRKNWEKNTKKYYALVEGCPDSESGVIKSWLMENKQLFMYSTDDKENGKYAVTHFKIAKQFAGYTLLDVELETGRKNQIRVHAADIGCPVVGDVRYGAAKIANNQIKLLAYYLRFLHPVKNEYIELTIEMKPSFCKNF